VRSRSWLRRYKWTSRARPWTIFFVTYLCSSIALVLIIGQVEYAPGTYVLSSLCVNPAGLYALFLTAAVAVVGTAALCFALFFVRDTLVRWLRRRRRRRGPLTPEPRADVQVRAAGDSPWWRADVRHLGRRGSQSLVFPAGPASGNLVDHARRVELLLQHPLAGGRALSTTPAWCR
jgi:hypothetical protein